MSAVPRFPRSIRLNSVLIGVVGSLAWAVVSAQEAMEPAAGPEEASEVGGPGIDEASVEAAINAGRYGEALAALQSVNVATSTDVFLLRWKAFCQVALEQYQSALRTADRILALSPGDEYGGFYRAQALAGMERLAEASRQLAKVVADRPAGKAQALVRTEMPEVIEEVAKVDLSAPEVVSGGAGAGRFDFSVSLGFGYDDNVALAPKGSFLPGGKDSSFMQAELKMDYRLLDQRIDSLPFTLTLGSGVFRSHYFDNGLDRLDYMIVPARVTLRHDRTVGGRDLGLELGGFYRYAWLGDSKYYETSGARAAVEYELAKDVEFSIAAEWMRSDYEPFVAFPGFYQRDGDQYGVTAEVKAWLFDNRVWINPGYSYYRDDAGGSRLGHSRQNGYLNVGVYLPGKFQLFGGVSYGDLDYGRYVPVPHRDDEMLTIYGQLRRPVFDPNLLASLSFTRMESRSNKAFANYDRNIALLQLTYTF